MVSKTENQFSAKILASAFILIFLFLTVFCVVSCTFSLQNVSTHGTATDLIDEDPMNTISPDISVPIKP